MSEYNLRQYRLMLDHLELYEQKNIDLDSLISGLESLLSSLENIDKSWEKEFRHQWSNLENEYSFFVVEKQKKISSQSQRIINEAITNLKKIVQEKIT